jgi:cation transport protein ChaC
VENEALSVSALVYVSIAAMCNMPTSVAGEQLRHVLQGHGRSASTATMSWPPCDRGSRLRDPQLHRLALMLHDQHSLHPPGQVQKKRRPGWLRPEPAAAAHAIHEYCSFAR